MLNLVSAAMFFWGIHFGLSGTSLRNRLVEHVGEAAFRAGFSLLSLAGMAWLIKAYSAAPYIETWGQLKAFSPFAEIAMLPAVALVVMGLTSARRNPMVLGQEDALTRRNPVQGILRVTRHPFLWGLNLWALTHLIVNGDAAALVLFGTLFTLCLGGTFSIDAKRNRQFGDAWADFAAITSNVPFVAIIGGRNRLIFAEIGAWRVALAVLVYLALFMLHGPLIGVPLLG